MKNDFIVYDKEISIFLKKDSDFQKLDNNDYGNFYEMDEWYPVSNASVLFNILDIDNDRFSVHNYIGKTDINDKKIYADSSIIEFEKHVCIYADLTGKKESKYQIDKYKGYFTFNEHTLRYNIKILTNSDNNVTWEYKNGQHRNLKIIDTIQENKL